MILLDLRPTPDMGGFKRKLFTAFVCLWSVNFQMDLKNTFKVIHKLFNVTSKMRTEKKCICQVTNKIRSSCLWTRDEKKEEKKITERRDCTYRLSSPPSMIELLSASQGEGGIKHGVMHGVTDDTMRLWVETLTTSNYEIMLRPITFFTS